MTNQKTKFVKTIFFALLAIVMVASIFIGGVDDTNKYIEVELRQQHYHKIDLPKY